MKDKELSELAEFLQNHFDDIFELYYSRRDQVSEAYANKDRDYIRNEYDKFMTDFIAAISQNRMLLDDYFRELIEFRINRGQDISGIQAAIEVLRLSIISQAKLQKEEFGHLIQRFETTGRCFSQLRHDVGVLIQEILHERHVAEMEFVEKQLTEKIVYIEEQQELVRELSTPVVEIWQGVLMLPLIGTIDSRRADEIMENVLASIVEQKGEMVILDITGVPIVDTEVANHLIKTVQATRLLGAECIIVGISPQIAQTLVQIGVDLSSVLTRANLQRGLMESFKHMGLCVVEKARVKKKSEAEKAVDESEDPEPEESK